MSACLSLMFQLTTAPQPGGDESHLILWALDGPGSLDVCGAKSPVKQCQTRQFRCSPSNLQPFKRFGVLFLPQIHTGWDLNRPGNYGDVVYQNLGILVETSKMSTVDDMLGCLATSLNTTQVM